MAGKILIAGKSPDRMNVNMPASGFIDKTTIKKVSTDSIITSEPFISLFKIKTDVLNAIVESMRQNGYDENMPIIIWKERNLLIDGHTRLTASKIAGIKTIPALYGSFNCEEDAVEYMHRIQFNRRNIADADLIRLIKDNLQKYEKKYGEGSKAGFLVKRFVGLSESKAKQTLIVIEKGTETDIDAIENGSISIYQTYLKLKSEKTTKNEKVSANFFEDDGIKQIVRCDDNGNFFYRNYTKKKEIKAFVLPIYLNTERIRRRIAEAIEEELGR